MLSPKYNAVSAGGTSTGQPAVPVSVAAGQPTVPANVATGQPAVPAAVPASVFTEPFSQPASAQPGLINSFIMKLVSGCYDVIAVLFLLELKVTVFVSKHCYVFLASEDDLNHSLDED
jgi:hypothetical protein